jgi:hypothetical protein
MHEHFLLAIDWRTEAFLAPPRMVVVATSGPSGMPHLTPNWYYYAHGILMISTTKNRSNTAT